MKKIVALIALIAVLPACRNTHKAKSPCEGHETCERVSGPAGWDIEEEHMNIK